MDRRQQKTREAIFSAFSTLLKTKKFSSITVKDIIDEANIGRSTFYAHFETKDELLKAMCTEIFEHVFSETQKSEKTHDFSSDQYKLSGKLTHILYHLKDSRQNITGILSGEGGELFMRCFKTYLRKLFEAYLPQIHRDVPHDFMLNQLVGSFAEAVLWWIAGGMKSAPEEIAGHYLTACALDETFA